MKSTEFSMSTLATGNKNIYAEKRKNVMPKNLSVFTLFMILFALILTNLFFARGF